MIPASLLFCKLYEAFYSRNTASQRKFLCKRIVLFIICDTAWSANKYNMLIVFEYCHLVFMVKLLEKKKKKQPKMNFFNLIANTFLNRMFINKFTNFLKRKIWWSRKDANVLNCISALTIALHLTFFEKILCKQTM